MVYFFFFILQSIHTISCYIIFSGSTCLPKAAIGDMGLDEWGYGQPNEYHSEDGQDCGEIWNGVTDRAGNPNGVNDRNCQIQRSFICEFTNSIAPSGIGKQDIVAQINNNNNPLYGPLNNPSGENNYYVMEFTSITAIILFASVILNMVLIALVCYLGSTGCNRKATTARYSKVNMYATEDEKL